MKTAYVNLFYRVPPDKKQLKEIKKQCDVMVKELSQELKVQFLEQDKQMQMALQSGQMLPERYELEKQKAQKMMADQIAAYEQECMSKLQAETSKIENMVISGKYYRCCKIL